MRHAQADDAESWDHVISTAEVEMSDLGPANSRGEGDGVGLLSIGGSPSAEGDGHGLLKDEKGLGVDVDALIKTWANCGYLLQVLPPPLSPSWL